MTERKSHSSYSEKGMEIAQTKSHIVKPRVIRVLSNRRGAQQVCWASFSKTP